MARRPRSILLPLTAAVATLFLTIKVDTLWQGLAVASDHPPSSHAAATPASVAFPVEPPGGPRPNPATSDASASLCSVEEMAVLQELAGRRDALDARDHALDERTDLLRAAEVRIEKKLAQLKALKTDMNAQIERRDAMEEQEILSLVKIYETMKAKSAAKIFETLDMPTLLLVVDRMKERKLAPVLAAMSAEKAQAVTVELAKTRSMADIAADEPAG
jgi:flagellar motility protein MotE (MotC chaperone)